MYDQFIEDIIDSLVQHDHQIDFFNNSDLFFTVRSVVSGGNRRTNHGARPLRVGRVIRGVDRRNQLFGTNHGVFLEGATEAEARQWANNIANRYPGATIKRDQHGQGRPHFHVILPGDVRSGHIFWGQTPSASFFDHDY